MTMNWVQKIRSRDWLRYHPLLSLQGLPEIVAASGISVRLWRAYAQTWLVCLLFPILFLVETPLTVMRLLLAVAGLVIFVFGYTWSMWPHPLVHEPHLQIRSRTSLLVLVGLTVLVLSLSLVYGSAFLWLFVGVSAMAGIALPAGHAFIAIVILTFLTLGIGVGMGGGIAGSDWFHVVPLLLLVRGLGVDMIGLARLAGALRELHAARDELAHQAVTEERLRLARDLHDLLGHTLSMIALKSELAGRLIEKDAARATQEVQEIERVARRALHEMRTAVAGYRQPMLHSELDGAQQILEAAGIAHIVEHTAGALPLATETVLAWAVREGVTNVVRHSRARLCTIRITYKEGTVCAELLNDGYRKQEQNHLVTGASHGLTGLTERIIAQGGQVEAGPLLKEDVPHFRLWVELPVERDVNSERRVWP